MHAAQEKIYGSAAETKKLLPFDQSPGLSNDGQWLPFDFDGKTFKARSDAFPGTAQFTRVFVALLGEFGVCL